MFLEDLNFLGDFWGPGSGPHMVPLGGGVLLGTLCCFEWDPLLSLYGCSSDWGLVGPLEALFFSLSFPDPVLGRILSSPCLILP